MRTVYKYAIFALTAALGALYVSRNWSSFMQLSVSHVWLIPVMAALVVLWQFLTSLNTKAVLSIRKLHLSVKESVALTVSSSFYNLVTPVGGVAVRAVYLKKKYSFSYTDFVTTLAAAYVLVFLASGLVGVVTMLVLYYIFGYFQRVIFTIFLVVLLGALTMVLFAPVFPSVKNCSLNKAFQVANGWHLVRTDKRLVLKLALLSLGQLITMAALIFCEFRVFDVALSVPAALLLAAIGCLSVLIAVTPAGLGINEAITVFTAFALGVDPAQSLSAAILGRLVSVCVLFIAGPLCSWYLLRKQDQKLRNRYAQRS